MRLRHVVIRRIHDDTLDRFRELIGHLASDGEVADLLYRRFPDFRGHGLLAVQKEVTIGLCGWRQDEGFGFLGPVLVRPEKRRWGVGKLLVAQAIEDMREDGIRSIESVFPQGDPVCERLFGGQGFRMRGDEKSETGVTWTRVEHSLKKT